jgi:flagellar biosynthesis protein FlhF
MDLKTFRAATMHEALMMVRRELGAEAAVLHTREVRAPGLLGLLSGARQIEVTASCGVNVPSRLTRPRQEDRPSSRPEDSPNFRGRPAEQTRENGGVPFRAPVTHDVQDQLSHLHAMVQSLCRQSQMAGSHPDLPEHLFRLFTDLLDADLGEELARELVERVRGDCPDFRGHPAQQGRENGTVPFAAGENGTVSQAKARIARLLEAEIPVAGPIRVVPGRRRLAALVGPTGVGKTTTIAKLAAHYRLREKRQVGLITVDTYRVAAVEQLRTYADIIDLPMQVVSTPREMHEAVARMAGLDLILMDTAGRSPKDEVRIQELRAFLSEAGADEVHLVLSSVSAARMLQQTAERFAAVGTTALVLTKLDEAGGLGSVLPLLRSSRLPLSYLTNGQNVPDDIEVAGPRRLARLILRMEEASRKNDSTCIPGEPI